MGIRNHDDFGSEIYIDELPTLRRKPSPKMLDLMRRARSLDEVARQFVDCVAFCLNALDAEPIDFAVMVDDAQDLDWDAYEAFLGGLSPGPGITAAASRGGRFQFRLVVCADEPGVRVEINEIFESIHGRVHMALDGPGTMSTLGSQPAPQNRKERRTERARGRKAKD